MIKKINREEDAIREFVVLEIEPVEFFTFTILVSIIVYKILYKIFPD